MSLQRCVSPAAAATAAAATGVAFRFSAASLSRTCPLATRTFSYSAAVRSSARRKIMTESALRPHKFDFLPPPPARAVKGEEEALESASVALDGLPPQAAGSSSSSSSSSKQEAPEKHNLSAASTASTSTASTSTASASASTASTSTASASATASTSASTASTPAAEAAATRPKRKLRARKAAVTLTPAAVEHLKELLELPDPKMIRVGVKNRGCSGLAYHLEYVDRAGTFDEVLEQDGVRVLIDSKALFSIIGSEMDWTEDKLSQRFVFKNPNITEQCGCGESFSVG